MEGIIPSITRSTRQAKRTYGGETKTVVRPLQPISKRKLDHSDYTIGWICALTTELVAAQEFLCEKHQTLDVPINDNNNYTLGTIGRHNIVIAVLPDGEGGISSATGVVKDMSHSFPNIRICLMVGIGGGAPSQKHDIRLGDVVVSAPRDGDAGVFQYDFGKTMQSKGFCPTGFLNQPPVCLRAAISSLKAQYESEGHFLGESIVQVLERNSRLQKKYKRPDPSTDKLYQSRVTHPPNNDASCEILCGDDPSKLILRDERTEYEDNPRIHYGLIASANQVMKNAFIRDQLIAEKDVLCFEMEAAGLMNQIPCLIIRGICDYSDSHKNENWQGYAAMIAAAYTKDLLYQMPPAKVEAEVKISCVISDLCQVAEEHRDIAKEHLQAQKDLAQEMLSDKEQKCHQLFRLITSNSNATYDWFKDQVEERLEGTCIWTLEHVCFRDWLNKESGPLLVSADPGCGKSVLAKYLIDHYLPCPGKIICYFFFKDQVQNTIQEALCAILHQLFSQKPFLIKHAMQKFKEEGEKLIHSIKSLWAILHNAVEDPGTGPIVIVLDALDECAESDFGGLIRNIIHQFQSKRHGRLNYLLTSRPYQQIVSEFHGLLDMDIFAKIHIPGEEQSQTISQEISLVIKYRGSLLAKEKRLKDELKTVLINELLTVSNRTYLWVYLVFDYLKGKSFKKTAEGIRTAIRKLPRTINDAYEHILSKSKEPSLARKAFCIILAANRPLTLSEMNIAINIDTDPANIPQSFDNLDIEEEDDFKLSLRSWCGLFIAIHQGNVYLLHQTAREFLLGNLASLATPGVPSWYHSITIHQAHTLLAEICVLYLNLFSSSNIVTMDSDVNEFFYYSAETWIDHFRKANITDGSNIIPFVLRICDPNLETYSVWIEIYSGFRHDVAPVGGTDLMVASYLGLYAIVKLLLDQGADFEAKDEYGRTPLSWAAENGHETISKLLLEKGAYFKAKGEDGRTPLSWAAYYGHEAIVKFLVEKGADFEAKGKYRRTPLLWAAKNRHEAIVKFLVEKGANFEAKDIYGRTPLLWAAYYEYGAIVKFLVEKGANINAKDKYGRTPLSCFMGG